MSSEWLNMLQLHKASRRIRSYLDYGSSFVSNCGKREPNVNQRGFLLSDRDKQRCLRARHVMPRLLSSGSYGDCDNAFAVRKEFWR